MAGTQTTYPDGSILTSSALTVGPNGGTIAPIFFPLTLGMLGILTAQNFPCVRVEWPITGQPYQQSEDDICWLRFILTNDPYSWIRDKNYSPNNDASINETWNYTRTWAIRFCCVGPNAVDRIRMIRSGLLQDYFALQFAQSNLYVVTQLDEPIRAPELINGQWFDRCDLNTEWYEAVTETITRPTVSGVDVDLYDQRGIEFAEISVVP